LSLRWSLATFEEFGANLQSKHESTLRDRRPPGFEVLFGLGYIVPDEFGEELMQLVRLREIHLRDEHLVL
jgi:hypothetical protein